MENMINIDYSYAKDYIDEKEILTYEPFIKNTHVLINEKKGAGSDFLGWNEYPKSLLENIEEIEKIERIVSEIKENTDVFLVVGIGGSYLGSRAVIDALSHHFYNNSTRYRSKFPEIHFIGQNMSAYYVKDLFEYVNDKKVSVNVISKSGTTTEPAIAFRLILEKMRKVYKNDEDLRKRIIATTSNTDKSALKVLSDQMGFEKFFIPEDIGGRYSVFTPVGLIPIAMSGINIRSFIQGAADMQEYLENDDIAENPAYLYAVIRNILLSKGKKVELMASFHQRLYYTLEWWKQLFGESEGKDKKGIFPASAIYSTDLHSLGQYMQDGSRHVFETFLEIDNIKYASCQIPKTDDNLDKLNYLAGKDLEYINSKAQEGTKKAHKDGDCPNISIKIKELSSYSHGALLYFFMKSCAVSAYLLAVNPFDQPGVEAYKKNMFELLGKPK